MWFTDFPSELQLFMLPLLDSLLGWRLMFLVSSTAMPVSVLLWIGAPFSFLLFPSGRKSKDRKKSQRQRCGLSYFSPLFTQEKGAGVLFSPLFGLSHGDSVYSRRNVHVGARWLKNSIDEMMKWNTWTLTPNHRILKIFWSQSDLSFKEQTVNYSQ